MSWEMKSERKAGPQVILVQLSKELSLIPESRTNEGLCCAARQGEGVRLGGRTGFNSQLLLGLGKPTLMVPPLRHKSGARVLLFSLSLLPSHPSLTILPDPSFKKANLVKIGHKKNVLVYSGSHNKVP